MHDQRTGEEHGLARNPDGRARRRRNLVERQEVDRDRGIADRSAVGQGMQIRGIQRTVWLRATGFAWPVRSKRGRLPFRSETE